MISHMEYLRIALNNVVKDCLNKTIGKSLAENPGTPSTRDADETGRHSWDVFRSGMKTVLLH